MLLVRLGGRRVFKSALIGSVTRLTGGNVENLNRETAEWAIAGGGPALGLAGGLGSVRSLFTPPGKQGAASLTGAMENVTTTQKVVTSQRQPMMKDVNINVTISIPTGVQLSAVEEAQQSTVIRESVVKSFQAATALVPTMGAAQTAPPPPVKSNSVPSPAKKPDVVKAAEPIRPKAAVPPIRKGSKVPLPQVGIGLVALAGLYALHKGLSSRRREKPRPSGEEASQASGAGGAAVAGEEEATTDSNGQLLKDQKLASELGSKAGEEGTVSEGGSKDLSAQEGETIQSLTGALEGLNHSPTATASPGKALGLTLAGAAVSTPNKLLGSHQHLTEGLDPEPVHAMLVKGAAGGSMGSLSEFAHTHEASELVGTGEGRSMERHAGGEEERRESNSAQAEEEVLKRVDTVVAVLREEYTPEIRTTELVKQAEGAARETGSEAKQPGKKPRVKKLRKRVKSVTRKAAQDNATELGADVYLGGAAKTPELVCEQTEIAEVGPATVIADEAAWVENGGAEGLGEAKLDTKAPDEAALLCEEVAKSTLTVEAAEVAVVPSKAEAEVEPALVGQSETAPECALDDADGGFQDAESSLEEGAESLLESADSLFEVVDGKKGEALQGRTSVVSVLENADDMEGDEASEWRVQKMEEEEKLEVGDPQRWGIGWDLAEAGGQWKTDEAPEGWSAGEKSLAGQRERLPVEGTWSVRNKLEEEGDEEVWSSTVTSLQDDGDVSEDMALQVGESVEQAVFTVAEKAVPDPTAAVLGASVDTETEAGARESEDWSDAVTWHPAVEPEALSSEKDEVALPTDVQLLEAKVAPSVLDRAGLDEGADIPLPPAEGAALVPALETVPVAVESFEIVLGKSKETAGTAELVGPSLAVEAEPVRVEPVVFEASEPHVATAEKEIVAEGDGIAVEGTERGPFSEEFSDFLEEEMVGETETEATAGDRAVLGVDSEDWTECVVMPGVDDRGVEYVEAGSLLNGVALTAGVTTGLDEVVGEAVEHGLIEDERLGQAAFGAPVEEQEASAVAAPNCKVDDAAKVRTLAVRGEWLMVAVEEPSATQIADNGSQENARPGEVLEEPEDASVVLIQNPAAPQVLDLWRAEEHAPVSPQEARFFVEEPEEFALVLAAGSRSPRVAGAADPGEVRVVEVEETEIEKHIIPESLKKREVQAIMPAPEADVSNVGPELSATNTGAGDVIDRNCVSGAGGSDGAESKSKTSAKSDKPTSQEKLRGSKREKGKPATAKKGGQVGPDWQLNGLALPENAVEVLLAGGKTCQSAEKTQTGGMKKAGLTLNVSKNPLYDADVCPSPGGNAPSLASVPVESPRLTPPTTVFFVAHKAAAPLETRAHKTADAQTGKVQKSGQKAKRRSGAEKKEVMLLEKPKAKSEPGGRGLHVAVPGWWDSVVCERTAAVVVVAWVIALIVAVLAYLERERSGAAGKPAPT